MKRLKTAGLLCAALFLFVMSGATQTKDDVMKAFNEGATAAKTKEYAKAVASFQQAIDLGTKVGVEADTLRKIAESNIAKIQFVFAKELFQNKASTNTDILAAFLKTKDLADKYGDEQTSAGVQGFMPTIYNNIARAAFSANDFPTAIANFDKVIALDPGNIQAYFSKGIVYKKQAAFEPMLQAFTKTIELATKSSDTVTIRKAKTILETEYMNIANAAFKKMDFKATIPPVLEALKYNDKDAQAYYVLAFSQNKLKEYDAALEAVTKGLLYEKPLKESLARFYYEQGLAFKAKGEKDKALESFKLAKFGKFIVPATAQIKDIMKPPVVAPVK